MVGTDADELKVETERIPVKCGVGPILYFSGMKTYNHAYFRLLVIIPLSFLD